MEPIQEIPDVFVCPGYKNIYPEQENIDPITLINGLPLYDVIHYVIERQEKVQYSYSDAEGEMELIYEMACYLDKNAKEHLSRFIALNPKQYLFGNISSLKFVMLALQTCDWTISHSLTSSDKEKIYKAYLCCNELWTNDQAKGIEPLAMQNNLPGMSLMADIPIVEFKHHKDFRPQLYKAWRLFTFMSSHDPYNSYLEMFLTERGVKCWQDYLTMLFSFYTSTLTSPIVNVDNANYWPFFDSLCIEQADCTAIWDHQDMKYLREHPLIKTKDGFYMVLNPNLLIDKLYQGVKFDVFSSMIKGGVVNKKGEVLTKQDFGDFSSRLGGDFSENEIFYDVMQKAFEGIADKIITGAEMQNANVKAPSDCYVRIGNSAFIFEYKDVTLSDDVKYSYDYSMIKKAILDRISKDDGRTRKGVGQLLFSINEAVINNSLSTLDPDIIKVSRFYPIVVTTDRSFSSMGIEYMLIESFKSLCKNWNIPKCIRIPMILDLDTLFLMSKRIHDRAISFPSIIEEYLNRRDCHIASFNTFYIDTYRELIQMDANDIQFLYNGILE